MSEHPDLIDDDGDRWTWNEYTRGYLCKKQGVVVPTPRETIENLYGPVKEARDNTVIKLPEVPEGVTKLSPVDDPDTVYEKQGVWWVQDGSHYSLAEVLDSHPRGVAPVTQTRYDQAVEFFRTNNVEVVFSSHPTALQHLKVIVDHVLENE